MSNPIKFFCIVNAVTAVIIWKFSFLINSHIKYIYHIDMMSIDPQHSNPRPAYYKLIYIIVWKNFLWAVRKPKELILFLVVPLAIVALSVYLRSSYKQKIETDKIYSDYPVESIA